MLRRGAGGGKPPGNKNMTGPSLGQRSGPLPGGRHPRAVLVAGGKRRPAWQVPDLAGWLT
jgi:hypothetical protein